MYNYDITYDWFQELYEIEYAQRKKKQDFTPHSVTEIVSQIALEGKECTIHEPTAGTGGLIISAWWETIKNKFLCCIPSKWTIIFDDLSHFAIFLSLLEHETPCKCPFGHLLSHIKQQTIGSNFY